MNRVLVHLCKPPWRTLVLCGGLLLFGVVLYAVWQPGTALEPGWLNRNTNGIWIQHGWLGDDSWFTRYNKTEKKTYFRNRDNILALKNLFVFQGISYVYSHMCPANANGSLPAVDPKQTELFLDVFEGMNVLPWIGGVLNCDVFLENKEWVDTFIDSARDLLETYPGLAGIHINVEPCPSGNRGFINLLKKLKETLPEGSILSVAAYPPPSRLHPFPEVHWEEEYFREVSEIADQIAVMMYDTSIRFGKLYVNLMYSWTKEVITWAGDCDVLLGVPAYDDTGVGYHHPDVENIENALSGITRAFLGECRCLPENYQGIALYSEWEMDSDEWMFLKTNFGE